MLSANAIQELGASKNDVNEQNMQALGFYLHIGFKVICQSPIIRPFVGLKPRPTLQRKLRSQWHFLLDSRFAHGALQKIASQKKSVRRIFY
mgnify:CR=1 FL=1|tara:strand:- start:21207 stop:21479 length:273 start_codon:yes stop_codon:yes gene_type:complete